MKGIILAGGTGSRLYPLTAVTSKQLLPVYDKPMIYYPLSILIKADIKDILIISTPQDIGNFARLLGDGSDYGVSLHYQIQESPRGLAHAFILAKEFIKDDNVAMILGDNIFILQDEDINKIKNINPVGATIFAYRVNNPEAFGVIEFKNGQAISIVEKPEQPKSHYCVTGLYFFDNKVVSYAESLQPSARGELEITDINNIYLQNRELEVRTLDKSFWIDAGTPENLLLASNCIYSLEKYYNCKFGEIK